MCIRDSDNYALMAHDPDYVRMLENLPEDQRRAWLLGQWDIFEGQYFAEFDRHVHVCRQMCIRDSSTTL